MKHVFSDNSEIAHLWMAQAQDNARNPSGNFYFDGRTIYSYGSHFPIAEIIQKPGDDARAVLFTTSEYSHTTAGHLSEVSRAIDRALPVFHVTRPNNHRMDNLSAYLADYCERIKALVATIQPRTRQAKRLEVFQTVVSTVDEANRFAEFIRSTSRVERPESLAAIIANIADAEKQAAEAAEALRLKREAKAKRDAARYRREMAAYLPVWRETGSTRMKSLTEPNTIIYLNMNAWPTMLRLDAESNQVGTSHGAYVPLEHAKRAFEFVSNLRAAGNGYQRNGHTFHVGPYALDSVDKKGNIKAGCHVIEWSEIRNFALSMGWIDTKEKQA